jgi:hypothetical protein
MISTAGKTEEEIVKEIMAAQAKFKATAKAATDEDKEKKE